MLSIALMSLLAAQPDPVLPGVSDQETAIAFVGPGSIREVHRGIGDVIFIRARTNQWYRIGLNKGCMRNFNGSVNTLAYDAGIDRRLDRSDRLILDQGRSCLIDSIRKSEAPPQVDSKSVVTLR